MGVRRDAAHVRAPRVDLIKMVQTFLRIGTEREASSMKRLIISALASAALFAAAIAMQRSPSTELSAGTATMLAVASDPHNDQRK